MKKTGKVAVCALTVILVLFLVSGCSSKSTIVGTWKDSSGGTMQFFNDGTFTSSGLISISGTYSFPDSSHLKIEYQGLMSIAGSQVYECQIDENKLTLIDSYGLTTELTKD